MSGSSDRTNATAPHLLGHVLRPDEFAHHASYDHALPAPELRHWVDRYWSVQWQLPPGTRFTATTIDDPSLHLSRERGSISRSDQPGAGHWLTGPRPRDGFEATLSGTGAVLAVKFAIGAAPLFAPTLQPDQLCGATAPADALFPGLAQEWADIPDGATNAAPQLDAWLSARTPGPDIGYERLRAALQAMTDQQITRLPQLAEAQGCTVRTLQRQFRRYAGVSPKWMLIRARVTEAIAALDRSEPHQEPVMADLAHQLGWSDQTHFIRDFRAVTGQTPYAYLVAARKHKSGPHPKV
ncbi:AraC family transcriptional regulator [Parenemella sanctibonifatiensis]|uniref:Transcriptional regulator n=1 Tax=Parenemella sanctibonifatiensis TaxID=2016505 RepID=A0A255E7Q9_9ACTN|nr:helix-turn-helix domain-containing protein [Parenemella sanctibonifatiensis]OYN87566.1 transcriptional regulator [Parenemella sanctibonifatiensis]